MSEAFDLPGLPDPRPDRRVSGAGPRRPWPVPLAPVFEIASRLRRAPLSSALVIPDRRDRMPAATGAPADLSGALAKA